MFRKSRAFLPRYQKFESVSLQRRVTQTLPLHRCPDLREVIAGLGGLAEGEAFEIEIGHTA